MSAGRIARLDRGGTPGPLFGSVGPMGLPPPAAGMLPLASGDRFVIAVRLEEISTARNIGAAGVRQPQYRSSFPRKRLSSCCSACSKTPAGNAAVVVNDNTPP